MTRRTNHEVRARAPLSALESEIMQAVWAAEPCTVESVHRVVAAKRDLKETSVRTLLRRLEQKGYIRHQEQGRAYVYRSAETARSMAARSVRQIIDRLCHGSLEQLVSGMVDAKVLSEKELESLETFVRNRKRGGH